MSQKSKSNLKRYFIFFLCNIPGTAIELLLTWSLSEYVFHRYFGMYVVTPVVSYEIAIVVDFILFFKFTWGDRMKDKGSKGFMKRLIAFNASTISVYAIRLLMIQFMAVVFHFSPVLCNVISMVFSGLMNFIINEKIIFAENRKHNVFVQVFMWLVRPFTKMKIVGDVKVDTPNGHGVVYVCNHGIFFGQIAAIMNLPDTIRPLVDKQMFNRQQFYESVNDSLDRKIKHWRGKTRDKLVGKLCDALIDIMQDHNPIPVVKNNSRNVFDTLSQSVNAIIGGANLLVFPERIIMSHHKDDDHGKTTRTFNSGFAHIGKIYHDMTDEELLFVPVYIDRKNRILKIADPIPYEYSGNDRNDRITLSDKIYNTLISMK